MSPADGDGPLADDRSRWIALYVLCTGMLVVILDGAIVNVALPSIQNDLGFTQSNLAWVVNTYLIAFGGLLLLAGRIGDLAARLHTRFGARNVLLSGLVLVVAGLLLLTKAPVDATYVVDVLPAMLLLGAGIGLSFPSLLTFSLWGATQSDAGLAFGLVNTTFQVGGGLAVLATLSTTRTENRLADGASNASALASGYHVAFLIGAALVAEAMVLAVIVLEPATPAKQTEDAPDVEPAIAKVA